MYVSCMYTKSKTIVQQNHTCHEEAGTWKQHCDRQLRTQMIRKLHQTPTIQKTLNKMKFKEIIQKHKGQTQKPQRIMGNGYQSSRPKQQYVAINGRYFNALKIINKNNNQQLAIL